MEGNNNDVKKGPDLFRQEGEKQHRHINITLFLSVHKGSGISHGKQMLEYKLCSLLTAGRDKVGNRIKNKA